MIEEIKEIEIVGLFTRHQNHCGPSGFRNDYMEWVYTQQDVEEPGRRVFFIIEISKDNYIRYIATDGTWFHHVFIFTEDAKYLYYSMTDAKYLYYSMTGRPLRASHKLMTQIREAIAMALAS